MGRLDAPDDLERPMSEFDKRKKGFEDKFAHDEEMAFKANARRNKLLGLWAAEKLGKTGDDAEAYAKDVVSSDFEEAGHEDVFRKVRGDFDAAGVDPLGRMMVTSEGYRAMTALLMEAADTLCGGRIVMTHEGGYSAMYVPYCGLAVIEELSGIRTAIEDPWAPLMAEWGQQALQPHQDAAIAQAEQLLAGIR